MAGEALRRSSRGLQQYLACLLVQHGSQMPGFRVAHLCGGHRCIHNLMRKVVRKVLRCVLGMAQGHPSMP